MHPSICGHLSRVLGVASILVLGACGSSAATPPETPGHDAHEHGEHEHEHGEHEHGEHGHGGHHVEGPLGEFHEVIAPVWHTEPGPKRVEAACAKTADMKQRAGTLGTPQGGATKDEAGWKKDVEALSASIDALTTACAAAGRAEVEPALSKVHDGFHGLMERAEGH